MTPAKPVWRVELTGPAEDDLVDILRWTKERFGERQAAIYETTLGLALGALRNGPGVLGAKRRDELGLNVGILHVARGQRRGRHIIAFRSLPDRAPPTLQVLRVLHDAMDLPGHLSDPSNEA